MSEHDTNVMRSPRIARCFVRLCSPPLYAQSVVGDLEEEFRRRVEEASPSVARSWYRVEAFRSGLRFGGHRAVRAFGPNEGLAVLAGATAAIGLLALSAFLGLPDLFAGASVSAKLLAGTVVIFATSVAGGLVTGRLAHRGQLICGVALGALFLLFIRAEAGVWPHPAWSALQMFGVVLGALTSSRITPRSPAT